MYYCNNKDTIIPMLIKIYPENPNPQRINSIVDVLKAGGVIIYPTDTLYDIGCDIMNRKAVERMAAIKGIRMEQALFSLLCNDLSRLADYSRPLPNPVFKQIKRNIPGPFTFILPANNNTPKLFQSRRKTVGIRIPDNPIARMLVEQLGNPLATTSIKNDTDQYEQLTDPELIYETYQKQVDIMVDGGYGTTDLSTVVDCTEDEPIVIRQGAGTLL